MEDLIAKVKAFFPERLHGQLLMVGGMVRDIVLGVECQDVDLVAAIPPSELAALGFRLVESRSTPDIYFLSHKVLGKIEVTRLSTLDELPDDLRGRDFTMNAMAMSLDGQLRDPLGGKKDLERKLLRTCSATSLFDDPARIFRAFRFECEGWRLDEQAESMIASRDWTTFFSDVPVERFAQEMLKALPKKNASRFFMRMVQLQVGENYLPEIFRMVQVPAGPVEYHPEGDLFTHSMQALERTSLRTPDPKARFCAAFHDLGKLSTPEEDYPKHHGHEEAGGEAAGEFCKRLRLPVVLQRALQATCRLHGNANRWEELRDSTKIRVAIGAMKGGIESFLPLIVAADCGRDMPGWEETLEVASLNAAQLGIPPEFFSDPLLPPEKCQQMILQRRVEELRRRLKAGSPGGAKEESK